MANKLFQMARNAVQQAVGKVQNTANEMINNQNLTNSQASQTNLSSHDMEVAQNAISSAMANSSDAERAQLAELQQELDAHSNQAGTSQAGQPPSFSQATGLSLEDAQNLLEDDQNQNKMQ